MTGDTALDYAKALAWAQELSENGLPLDDAEDRIEDLNKSHYDRPCCVSFVWMKEKVSYDDIGRHGWGYSKPGLLDKLLTLGSLSPYGQISNPATMADMAVDSKDVFMIEVTATRYHWVEWCKYDGQYYVARRWTKVYFDEKNIPFTPMSDTPIGSDWSL